MSDTDERKSKAAEDMKSELRAKDDARREAERRGVKNLNQGMDSSGHDATHPGVNWGPSYTTRRKAKPKPAAETTEDKKSDSQT